MKTFLNILLFSFLISYLNANQNISIYLNEYDICYQECAGEDGCIMETENCVESCRKIRDKNILKNLSNEKVFICIIQFDECSYNSQTSCSLDASLHNRTLLECKQTRDSCIQNILK